MAHLIARLQKSDVDEVGRLRLYQSQCDEYASFSFHTLPRAPNQLSPSTTNMAWSKEKVYVWYVCLVAAMTIILCSYDSSTFNAVQGSPNWKEYFHHPDPSVVGP